jgi:hypothetical protein
MTPGTMKPNETGITIKNWIGDEAEVLLSELDDLLDDYDRVSYDDGFSKRPHTAELAYLRGSIMDTARLAAEAAWRDAV